MRVRIPLLAALVPLLLLPSAHPTAVAASIPGAPGCSFFPANSVWNTDVSSMPVNAKSPQWVASMSGGAANIHPDFGKSDDPSVPYGIPYTVVDNSHATTTVNFDYGDESDTGPYPFGTDTPIEGGAASGGDRHALMVNSATCTLYELYDAHYATQPTAGSGSIWNMASNILRPDSWTSADAAGLPILPGLLRYDEVLGGSINHAVRVTAATTTNAHIWPARHDAGSSSAPNAPPMGARLRMRASFDASHYSAQAQTIITAFKHYGMLVADNGSNWFVSGTADNSWPDSLIAELKTIPASQFDAIDESSLMISPGSGQARQYAPTPPGSGGVFADGYGGLHAFGNITPSLGGASYWPGWDVVRGAGLRPAGGAYTLDAYGGVHPAGGAPVVTISAYWPGWAIARGIAVRAQGGGYVLDGFGGLHPFGGAPAVTVTAYWKGWDIARGLVLADDGARGYVVDGFGGIHPFSSGGTMPPTPSPGGYWPGWDIARGVTLVRGSATAGYSVDGYGGVHAFGGAPTASASWYASGSTLVCGIAATTAGGGYTFDVWGGVHPFGAAPWVNAPAPWPGWPISHGGSAT